MILNLVLAKRQNAIKNIVLVITLVENVRIYVPAINVPIAIIIKGKHLNNKKINCILIKNIKEEYKCHREWTSSQFNFLSYDFL